MFDTAPPQSSFVTFWAFTLYTYIDSIQFNLTNIQTDNNKNWSMQQIIFINLKKTKTKRILKENRTYRIKLDKK